MPHCVVVKVVMPQLMPLSIIRNMWNHFIVPLAVSEPLVLHSVLSTHWYTLQALGIISPGECEVRIYSDTAQAITLLNQKMDVIDGQQKSTLEVLIAGVMLLTGQEV